GDRVGERDLARLVDEEVVERLVELRLREQPRRSGDEGDIFIVKAAVGGLDESPVVRAALLQPDEVDALVERYLLDLAQEVVDRLVALRRHRYALAAVDQVDDQARARPRLAGAGRPLDEQVAALDALDERFHLV